MRRLGHLYILTTFNLDHTDGCKHTDRNKADTKQHHDPFSPVVFGPPLNKQCTAIVEDLGGGNVPDCRRTAQASGEDLTILHILQDDRWCRPA